jgi:hypothetical protein
VLQLDPSPVKVEGRGATPWTEAQGRRATGGMACAGRQGEADVLTVLRDAEHTLNVMAPVVHHDLHDIAAKKTHELLERDKLVSDALSRTTMWWECGPCAYWQCMYAPLCGEAASAELG